MPAGDLDGDAAADIFATSIYYEAEDVQAGSFKELHASIEHCLSERPAPIKLRLRAARRRYELDPRRDVGLLQGSSRLAGNGGAPHRELLVVRQPQLST